MVGNYYGLQATCRDVGLLLTFHYDRNGLAGLVVAILVVDSLHVVASGIGGHAGQDHQSVVLGDGAAREESKISMSNGQQWASLTTRQLKAQSAI